MTRPTCHPDRAHKARGQCKSCYETDRRRRVATDQPPTKGRRSAADFADDYQALRAAGVTLVLS